MMRGLRTVRVWHSHRRSEPRFLGRRTKALRVCLGVAILCSVSVLCGVLLAYWPELLFVVLVIFTTVAATLAATVSPVARIAGTVCRAGMILSITTCLLCFSLSCLQFVLLLIPEDAIVYAFSDRARFPIANVGGIAVDGHKNTYLALQGYHRIQVYDADGRFVRGWFVDRPGGGRMRLWYDGRIHVLETRTIRHYVFATDGRLVDMKAVPSSEAFAILWDRAQRLQDDATLSQGIELRSYVLLPPEVVSVASHTSAPTPVVRDPYYLACLRLSPILILVLLVNSVITAAFYRRLRGTAEREST